MKLWNYIFMIITMILFFQFMGWSSVTTSPISNFTGINMTNVTDGGVSHIEIKGFNISVSYFKDYLFSALLLTLLGSGIAIGLFAAGQGDIAIKAGIASALFVGFISSLYIPLTKGFALGISSWAMGILAMIFIPFTVGFFFALIDWVVGSGD